jgi:hypothetical protein
MAIAIAWRHKDPRRRGFFDRGVRKNEKLLE